MDIKDYLNRQDLSNSLLIGYYGGGNFGDELLLETLLIILNCKNTKNLIIAYEDPSRYTKLHKDYGYKIISRKSIGSMIKAIFSSKYVIIGGGGLWGLDANLSVLILSSGLFVSKWLFRKNILLIGVGYYNSTGAIGRISGYLAGKSASLIIARDGETFDNFHSISKNVYLGRDIAFALSDQSLSLYEADAARFGKDLVNQPIILVGTRWVKGLVGHEYNRAIKRFIDSNPKMSFIVIMLAPKDMWEESYIELKEEYANLKNVHLTDLSENPITLYVFLKKYRDKISIIAPQYHFILSAYLNGVPFLPIAYDNKVIELFKQIGQEKVINLKNLTQPQLQKFADEFYGDDT